MTLTVFLILKLEMTRSKRSRRNKPSTTRGQRRSEPLARTQLHRTEYRHSEIRLRHSEFLDSVEVPGGVESRKTYRLNPGLATTFPWLARIARNYETYTVHRIAFRYVPRCSATQAGYIVMAPDWDPSDDNSGASRRSLLAFEGATTCALWTPVSAVFSGKMLHRKDSHYVRTATPRLGEDIKLYDVGQLEVLIKADGVSEVIAGDIFIDYDITLTTPQIMPTIVPHMESLPLVGVAMGFPMGMAGDLPTGKTDDWTNSTDASVTSHVGSETWASRGYSFMLEVSDLLSGMFEVVHHGTFITDTGTPVVRILDSDGTLHVPPDGAITHDLSVTDGDTIIHTLSMLLDPDALEETYGITARWCFGYLNGDYPAAATLVETLISTAVQFFV